MSSPISIIDRAPFVIFLDIDGVLYNTPDQNGVFKKVDELFPNAKSYDNRVCSIAASYFFNKEALNNLDKIISELEKTKKVSIVISSAWREGRTVEELRKTFFGIHNFSKYIIDKTPKKISKEKINDYCSKGWHYSHCRAAEIQYWLKEHPEVVDYLILDDIDDHLSSHFGEKFFETNFNTLLTSKIAGEILKNYICIDPLSGVSSLSSVASQAFSNLEP